MGRFLLILIILISPKVFSNEVPTGDFDLSRINSFTSIRDTIPDDQLLFNGRIWRSAYSYVVGDEFLFSKEWFNGDVTMNEMTFHNVRLRYDILNDQLLVFYNKTTFIQLNKEMIKEFTITHDLQKDTFENFSGGKDNPVNGFGQVLYKGNIYLIYKHIKRIQQLAVDNKYDEFYKQQTLYILKEGKFYKVNGRKDLINILSDKKQKVQVYMRENKLRIKKKEPASYIPVLKYYDTLKDPA
jgi:hypothetical protein